MAFRIFKRLRDLVDVDFSTFQDGDRVTYRASTDEFVGMAASGGASSAADVDFTPAGNVAATDVQAAIEELDTEKASASAVSALTAAAVLDGDAAGGVLAGTYPSPSFAVDMATQAELDAHAAAADPHPGYTTAAELAAYAQPVDSDLTAIAALSTTSFGRSLLALADAAALLSAAGAAAASHVHAGEDITSGTVADARIASTLARDSEVTAAIAALSTVYQPLDSDLTAIAALTTTSFGRGLLAEASASTLRSTLSLVPGTDVEVHDADLTTIAGLTPTNDDVLQRKSGAWTNRTIAQLLTDLGLGALYQPLDSDLTAFAALAIAADKLPYGSGSHALSLADFTAAARALLDDADASAMLTTLGLSTFVKTLMDDADASTFLSTLGVSTFIKTLLDDADAATARATLGIAGGITQAYVGYNTVGGSTETITGGRAYAKLITLANDCYLSDIEVYLKGDGSHVSNLGAALLEDNAGAPAKVICSTQAANTDVLNMTGVARWYGTPIGRWCTAGDYWIVIKSFDAETVIAYDSGSDKIWAEGGAWFSDGANVSPSNSSRKYSMRANTIR